LLLFQLATQFLLLLQNLRLSLFLGLTRELPLLLPLLLVEQIALFDLRSLSLTCACRQQQNSDTTRVLHSSLRSLLIGDC
jgi:hypothetical protein